MTTDWIDGMLLGNSDVMRRLRALILRIGPTTLPVFVEGPTGSGKELVARAVHRSSGRCGKLVAFNVCAIPESVFESALFGHVRGAFTGATSDALGYLREGNRGTVFFDEIAGLSLDLQIKLLRAVETHQFRPLGARADQESDFRVIAATNEAATTLLTAGRLREDLYERIAAVTITVPPLRERPDDVPLLARHFLAALGGRRTPPCLTDAALRTLQEYDWPRNVRQLKNTLLRAAAFSSSEAIGCEDIAEVLQNPRPPAPVPDSFERRRLLSLLEEAECDVTLAATRLGIDRATLYRRLKRHGVDVTSVRITARNNGSAFGGSNGRRATSHDVAATMCDNSLASSSEILR